MRLQYPILAVALAVIVPCLAGPAAADVTVAEPVFHRDMVLQRDREVAVWGRAARNERVRVEFGDASVEAVAGNDGQWTATLPPMTAHAGRTLTVSGAGSRVTLENVAVGEVWLCAGQSNMTLDVGASKDGKEEAAAADYPAIRFYDHLGWHVCTPKTAPGLSAVAYYFARDIHKELGVPVAVVTVAQSMSAIQPWTPIETLDLEPALKEEYDTRTRIYLGQVRQWLERSDKAFADGKPIDRVGESDITQVGTLFRGNIQGFTRFAARGFLWYQGESNTRDGAFYATRMRGLVKGWRKLWGRPEMPFYFVQIAPFDAEGDLPALWEAQLAAARALPACEVSHSSDLGYSIHPPNKQAVGHRLALIALAKTYGKQGVVFVGPRYKSHAVDGDRVRVAFDGVGSGLVSRDGKPLTFFEVAAADGKFVPAEAVVDGNEVVVRAAGVDRPRDVRFAWKREAVHNLSNKDGLPAYPFRTEAR